MIQIISEVTLSLLCWWRRSFPGRWAFALCLRLGWRPSTLIVRLALFSLCSSFLLFFWLLSGTDPQPAYGQYFPTPTGTLEPCTDCHGTPTVVEWQDLFPSSTPQPTADTTCPQGQNPAGLGTVTPGPDWKFRCGQCVTRTPAVTSAPTRTPSYCRSDWRATPVPGAFSGISVMAVEDPGDGGSSGGSSGWCSSCPGDPNCKNQTQTPTVTPTVSPTVPVPTETPRWFLLSVPGELTVTSNDYTETAYMTGIDPALEIYGFVADVTKKSNNAINFQGWGGNIVTNGTDWIFASWSTATFCLATPQSCSSVGMSSALGQLPAYTLRTGYSTYLVQFKGGFSSPPYDTINVTASNWRLIVYGVPPVVQQPTVTPTVTSTPVWSNSYCASVHPASVVNQYQFISSPKVGRCTTVTIGGWTLPMNWTSGISQLASVPPLPDYTLPGVTVYFCPVSFGYLNLLGVLVPLDDLAALMAIVAALRIFMR